MNLALTVAGELALASVAKRCLMYKMNSMGDQMCGLIWNLAQFGFTAAIRNVDDKNISNIISGVDRNVPETLINHPQYENLRQTDLAGSIAFVYKIMLDKRRKIAHQHTLITKQSHLKNNIDNNNNNNETSITNYFEPNPDADSHGHEWECHSPLCTESFREICEQLEESANLICQQIVKIRHEHMLYAKSYKIQQWIYGINDEIYWYRLKSELPILDKRINRFLTAIPWCVLIGNEPNQSK